MPAPLEDRRRAIAEALRSVMREQPVSHSGPRTTDRSEPAPTVKTAAAAPVAIHMHGVEARLDAMSRQLTEVVLRLGCVQETLATVASRPAVDQPLDEEPPPMDEPVVGEDPYVDDEPFADDDRVSVPAVALDEVRMSSTAAEALFGG